MDSRQTGCNGHLQSNSLRSSMVGRALELAQLYLALLQLEISLIRDSVQPSQMRSFNMVVSAMVMMKTNVRLHRSRSRPSLFASTWLERGQRYGLHLVEDRRFTCRTQIEPITRIVTTKQNVTARSTNKKPSMKDLPTGLQERFSSHFIPRLRDIVATLPPWEQPDDDDIRSAYSTAYNSESQLRHDEDMSIISRLVCFDFYFLACHAVDCFRPMSVYLTGDTNLRTQQLQHWRKYSL